MMPRSTSCGAATPALSPIRAALLVGLWLLLCALPSLSAAERLVLDHAPASASGYLQRLDDPSGTLSAEQVIKHAGWQSLPGTLNAGFTYQTVWLKLELTTPAHSPPDWIVALSNALLDDVELYLLQADGSVGRWQSGENLDRTRWPIDYRAAAFALALEPEQRYTVLLRLQTKNAMATSVTLFNPTDFGQQTRYEYLFLGLYFGVYLALFVFHGVFWRMTQADDSGWYLFYVSFCFSLEIFSAGLVQQFTQLPVTYSDPILGCIMAASLPIGFIFAQRQLRTAHYAKLRKVYALICLMLGGTAGFLILAGHYQIGAPLVQIPAMLTILVLVAMATHLCFKGHRPALIFLLIFGVYYIGVIVGFLRNLGIVPTRFYTDHATAIGTILHMVLMSSRIIYYYRQMERDKRHAQYRLKHLLEEHNSQLEQQISHRTHELRAEINRRTLLEGNLRQALEHEQQMHEEQRDFVAMVSHEFRTPLAIISTTAQQISRNLGAPAERNEKRCQNIRDASARLMTLVNDYLSNDRLDHITSIQRTSHCTLEQLLAQSIIDLPQGRVAVTRHTRMDTLNCDEGLVKIALRNMIANADRHTPEGGVIELQFSERPGFLDIRVSHQGPVIPEEQAPFLFQKYFRGSQAQHSPGAGLGLYITQRIAQLHEGEVCLESRGQDGIICFRLSLATEQNAQHTLLAETP